MAVGRLEGCYSARSLRLGTSCACTHVVRAVTFSWAPHEPAGGTDGQTTLPGKAGGSPVHFQNGASVWNYGLRMNGVA